MPHVSLRKIGKENFRDVLYLKLKPEQEGLVATNAGSLAQAKFHDEAWIRAVYADEQAVGFVMLSILPEEDEYFLWRFMIAAEHQGKGYGRQAIEKVVEHVSAATSATELRSSYKKVEHGPEGFYLKCGFELTGEVEDGEHIIRMALPVATGKDRLQRDEFPLSSKYNADWILEGPFGGNAVWLAEWLMTSLKLEPGMRVLDLGCGRAKSSIFLANEFDVQVWATDLWINATENCQRIESAGLSDRVFPIHADARALPYAAEFFDAIVCLDAFPYFGTDDLYLNYLAQFVKPGGQIGVAGAGLMKDFGDSVPKHLERFWTQSCWPLHTAEWWREHWAKTKIMDVEVADTMPDGIGVWQQWNGAMPDPVKWFVDALDEDNGEYLGYFRMIGRRNKDAKLEDYCWPDATKSWPIEFKKRPVFRDE